MKIVFFGTGDFSTTVLKGLVEDGKEIVGVVTQPDKVNARNNKVVYSQIKQYCLEKNIPKEKWTKFHHAFVLHGRYVCKSQRPLCNECPVSDICRGKRD